LAQKQYGIKQFLKINSSGEPPDWELPIICQPKYSIKFWNVYERIHSSIIRTNNSVEISNSVGVNLKNF